MSKRITQEELAQQANVVEAPRQTSVVVDRTFELPSMLYGATVGLYLAFLAITFAGFGNPGLIIPMAIFTVFIVAGFGVPALWSRLKPETKSAPLSSSRFFSEGIMTNTGRLAPRDATIQMLILPVLIMLWGLAVVTIAAIV